MIIKDAVMFMILNTVFKLSHLNIVKAKVTRKARRAMKAMLAMRARAIINMQVRFITRS